MDKRSKEKRSEDKDGGKKGSVSGGGRKKSKKPKAEDIEESFKAVRRSTASSISEGLEAPNQNRWGWKGNRSTINLGGMSHDISLDKRRSTIGFGTAPGTEYDYSILHRYKRLSHSKSAPDEDEEQEGRDSLDREDRETDKPVESWKWRRDQKDDDEGVTEKQEEEPQHAEEERKESIPKEEPRPIEEKKDDDRRDQKGEDSLKSEESEKATPAAQRKSAGVSPAPSTSKRTPDKYEPGKYEVLKPDKSGLQKLAGLDVNKQKKAEPARKTPSKDERKAAVVKFQSHPPEQKPQRQPQPPQKPPQVPKVAQPPPPPPTPPPPKPTPSIPAPSSTFSTRLSTDVTSVASDLSTGRSMSSVASTEGGKSRQRRRKPRPSDLSTTDFDLDDELSSNLSDESKRSTAPRRSLSIFEDGNKHPDDELLYSLTAKEEIIFRKSVSEMRWEEEESMSEGNMGYTTGGESSSDMESTAAAILWERIGAGKKFEVPMIRINDRRISLGHLDPEDPEIEEGAEQKEKYQNVFNNESSAESSGSDSDPVQAIFDLLDEVDAKKRKSAQDEDKKAAARAKLWRRRLTVVVLLNFVVRSRQRFSTFCSVVVPVIVFGVLISGMIWNSSGVIPELEGKVKDSEAGKLGFDPFEPIGKDAIYFAFCSNEEFCSKGSSRNYYIVYSPSNKFIDDIMLRALRILNLENEKKGKIHRMKRSARHFSVQNDDDDESPSRLIGAANASEVERLCKEHWNKVAKFDDEVDADGSDIFERQVNKERAASRLVRYPMGIVFSMEGNLIGQTRLKQILNEEKIPETLAYTIRTFYPEVGNTVEGFPFKEQTYSGRKYSKGQRHFLSSPYLHTGILGMQLALDFAYAEKIVKSAESKDPELKIGSTKIQRQFFLEDFKEKPTLKQFEYPTYKGSVLKIKGWLTLTMTIVFSYLVGDILEAQDVVHNQNSGSIELLKIHGMTTSMRWISNLILFGIFRAITTLAMALIIHYMISVSAVAAFSSPLFLWLFLWMHACTVTCFNYFITSGLGVKKPELAGLVVVCVCFTSMLSPVHLFVEGYLNRFINVALCFLLPQWNLANGMYYYLRYEQYDEGLQWYDFPVLMDTEKHLIIALPLSCNIFLYSTMFYLSLTIYMDHILPREFSPRETWLFFCKSFTRREPSESQSTRPIPRSQRPSVYELGPKDAAYGPRFRNVTVTDNKVTVLDNISLDIYEGEVTCIVGQIGSGKSDFLNVIAGVNVPSSGFVDVKGLKVHEYHDITNRYVSLCPQRQLLIGTLSVEDHIRLCCMLHGATYAKAKTQATFLLKMFGLMPMRRHAYQGLTKNDIKKVMLAMALSKSPSVLLLDNPIDQLDSDSRLQFWKLLQELKPERSIIVTCTTLEEAQLYGDRIAILSKGKLVCYGSPQYIRLAYGIGNVMTLRMAEGMEPDIWTIQQMMHKELLGAKTTLLETKGVSLQADTIKFIMPFGKFYGGVLEKLEDSMERFGIAKILMSQPSLWALFLKIALHPSTEQVLAKREIRMIRGADPVEHEGFENAVEPQIPVQKEIPNHSLLNIVGVLVLKKYWYYRQKYFTFILAYLPQLILIMMTALHARLFLIYQPESLSKVVSIRMYENNHIVFRSADNANTRKGWNEAFKHVLEEDEPKVSMDILSYEDNLEEFLSHGLAHTLTHYHKQTIIAFNKDKAAHVGYYSSNSIHSAPIATHVMMQTFLYLISPNRTKPCGTVLVNNPFLQYPGFPAGSTQSNSSTIMGLFLSIILCLLSAPVLRMILTERGSKFKLLQRMTGVSTWIYWFSHVIADYGMYLIITLICWGMVIFLDNIAYQQCDGWEERLALVVIFSAWLCWAALPYTYLLACLLPQKVTGYGYYTLYHFLFGIIPKVVTYQFLRLHVGAFYTWLRYILYIFPPYALTSACVHFFHVVGDERWCRNADPHACDMYKNISTGLQNKQIPDFEEPYVPKDVIHFLKDQIAFNDSFRTCCKAFCEVAGTCHDETVFFNVFDSEETVIPGLKHDIFALMINGIVFWILTMLYEHEILQSVFSFVSSKVCGNLELTVAQRDVKTSDEPEDVKQEHQRVDYMVEIEGDVDSEVYLVQDVTKFYKYTKGLDHIYFSVPINSITGLLGLPKSGKTTILDILTGNLIPSSGYIYKDNDLLEGKTKNHLMMRVGYSPQKPCLLSYLTGVQMLTVMGRLRGLSKQECEQHVLWWIQLFELEDVANKKCSTYRKGQEQRLCCALALIGDTSMVIFDEPTVAMDNYERYIFWNIISRLPKTTARTVLFASINADEVQHQSSKALLMESGTIVAVGHLTEIFKNNNQGMTLAIRYSLSANRTYTEFQKKTKVDKLKDHVIQYLSPCALMDEQENLLIYHLKDQNLKLSRVYAVMEGAKVRFTTLMDHFQVFEPSLDDIILQFHKARVKRQSEKFDEVSSATGADKPNRDKANSTGETPKVSV